MLTTDEPPPINDAVGDDLPDPPEDMIARRRFERGDVEAFRQLFDTYFDRLYRYVFRYLESPDESQDVVQDVFLQMWHQRERIGLEHDLRSYLYVTARNHALNRLKRRKVEQRFRERRAAALAEEGVGLAPDPDTELAERNLAAVLQRAIDALPPRQREILRLRWEEHLSYQEVGQVLGISPKTVAIHVGRALARLRAALPGMIE